MKKLYGLMVGLIIVSVLIPEGFTLAQTTSTTTSTTTSSTSSFTQSQITSWAQGWSGQSVSVSTNASASTPPNFSESISNGGSGAPSSVQFQLENVVADGSTDVTNDKWLIFQGYDNNQAVPGLYFVTGTDSSDDVDQNGYYLYAPNGNIDSGITLSEDVSGSTTDSITQLATAPVDTNSVQTVFDYVMMIPYAASVAITGNNNCNSGTMFLTGPSPTTNSSPATYVPTSNTVVGQTVSSIQSAGYQTSSAQAFSLNSNCIANATSDPNGWMASWKVTEGNNMGGQGGCTFSALLDKLATTDIGTVIAQILGCAVTTVITSVLGPVTNFLSDISGISYLPSNYPSATKNYANFT